MVGSYGAVCVIIGWWTAAILVSWKQCLSCLWRWLLLSRNHYGWGSGSFSDASVLIVSTLFHNMIPYQAAGILWWTPNRHWSSLDRCWRPSENLCCGHLGWGWGWGWVCVWVWGVGLRGGGGGGGVRGWGVGLRWRGVRWGGGVGVGGGVPGSATDYPCGVLSHVCPLFEI